MQSLEAAKNAMHDAPAPWHLRGLAARDFLPDLTRNLTTLARALRGEPVADFAALDVPRTISQSLELVNWVLNKQCARNLEIICAQSKLCFQQQANNDRSSNMANTHR